MRLEDSQVIDDVTLPRDLPMVSAGQVISDSLNDMLLAEAAEGKPRRKMSREEYRESYLQSNEWRATRSLAIERAGRRCADCGFTDDTKHLDAHHLTYERLGHELLSDLIVVCRGCHSKRHEESA